MEALGSWKDIYRGAELFATLWETSSEVRPPSVAIGRLVLLSEAVSVDIPFMI